MVERSLENFDYWLKLHSLPLHFPRLSQIDDPESGPFLRNGGEEIRQITEQVQGAFRSMIVFPPGQGASTMLSELVRRLRASDVRLYQLLVVIDVARFRDADDLPSDLDAFIRRDLFEQLILQGWVRALFGQRQQQLLSLFGVPSEKDLFDLEYDLRARQPSANERLSTIAEGFAGRTAELYRRLYEQLGLSVTLAFDFPWAADDELVLEIFREVKWFDENEKPRGFPPSALRETYFLTRKQANLAKSVWTVNFADWEFKPYGEGEVFSILSHHFRPYSGVRHYPLINALSDAFISRVWAEGSPLAEMMDKLKQEMLRALDLPRGRTPYTLEPKTAPRGGQS